MRIIVTGAGGFVGRALVRRLTAEHIIVALDRACDSLANIPGATLIEGDLTDEKVIAAAVGEGCDAVIHLATVPGGAAEQDPAAGWRVNIDGTAALVEAVCRARKAPRFFFASSIAVFGDPLPPAVDDDSPLRPRMLYGAHKAMMEQWLATMTRRGALDAASLRLPGILARPRAPSGMKSAFMSDLFHAARVREMFVAPVSPEATMWLMSRERIVQNLAHALTLGRGAVGEPFALTLPAVRCSFGALVGEVARQAGIGADFVRYAPDVALEAGFGRQPPLTTRHADRLGFTHDGTVEELVAAAFRGIEAEESEKHA